jgi:hypothetical protein
LVHRPTVYSSRFRCRTLLCLHGCGTFRFAFSNLMVYLLNIRILR